MDKYILLDQYKAIQSARSALLDHCKGIQWQHLTTPIAVFNNNTIVYLLLHTANTYLHWLLFFEEQLAVNYYKEEDIKQLSDIEQIYVNIDELTIDFLKDHQYDHLVEITRLTRNKQAQVTATPLQLYTHAVTHEFHHKGQILSMSRLLGYTPADTDVIRF